MSRALNTLKFLARYIVLGLAAAFVVTVLRPDWVDTLQRRFGTAVVTGDAKVPAAFTGSGAPTSFARAVRRAAPAVVSVYAERVITERPFQWLRGSPLGALPGFSLGAPRRRFERAGGSGVIVSSDGYVLTNHHVVAGADQIQLVLWDGRTTRARIIGSDPETDLAVLKLDGSDLPALSLDPERAIEVGDVVLAIGSPFGLRQTVTQGIVSALERSDLKGSTYGDLIQTDAAINAGNSGGALINAKGELIGINKSVLENYNPGETVEGIGFAIRLSTATNVFRQIVSIGVVVRGWLGAEYGDATILPGSLQPGAPRGVALKAIYRGGPADQAGLRAGDVLVTLNAVEITGETDLREREAALPPGARVILEGWRAGVPFHTEVTLMQRPLPQGS